MFIFYGTSNSTVLELACIHITLAFVMINSAPDQSEWVLERIREVKGVEEAYRLYGVYDIVAVVKAETTEELKGIIFRIRKVKHILSSMPLFAIS